MSGQSDTAIFTTICEGYNPEVKPCYHYLQGGFCKLPEVFRCIEYIRKKGPTISYSSIEDYTRCHRRFWWSYIAGIELKEKRIQMVLGSIAHEILAYLHSTKETDQNILKQYVRSTIKRYEAIYINDGDEKTLTWPVTMGALFYVYIDKSMHTMKGLTEYKWMWKELEHTSLKGFIDLVMPELTIGYEWKYSARPDDYNIFILMDQLSAYFIGEKNLERITARIIVPPALRLGKNEIVKDYFSRVYSDVNKRPTYYFRDMNYFRTEFDLEGFKKKTQVISLEVIDQLNKGKDAFYLNTYRGACLHPYPCDYKQICETGVVSGDLYKKRELRKEKKNGADAESPREPIKKEFDI